jgi:2-oxoglutarate dehydrogenase E2 component (dihydrolipoamide succinyltransferase)
MVIEMKIPSPGESITEVEIARWLVEDGAVVEKDDTLCEIDSDKATLELNAEESGKVKIIAKEGEKIAVGAIACSIDTSVQAEKKSAPKKETVAVAEKKEGKKDQKQDTTTPVTSSAKEVKASPVAKEMIAQNGIKADGLKGSGPGGRIIKADIIKYITAGVDSSSSAGWGGTRDEERNKMSSLRRKISERLVSVKNQTAMLTTFNEVDMSNVISLRNKYKDSFKEQHQIGLGFMSFFTKAVTEALRLYPAVNSQIDKDEVISYNYADIGIAVSAPKGLMVPVLRNAERMTLAEIEKKIKELAIKARDGKITVDEMTGGTFTITNGGVFGSMLSTPIINPPQSAILGMHNIVDRPVAVNGKVEVRPVMYVALSYDHRIIDGKESVGFLYAVKEMIENPSRLIFGGKNPEEVLLGL